MVNLQLSDIGGQFKSIEDTTIMKKALFLALVGLVPAIAFGQMDFRLYGINMSNGDLVEINKTSGETTTVMNLDFIRDFKHGFDFDPSVKALCVTDINRAHLSHTKRKINLETGTAIAYGSIGANESTEGLGLREDGNAYVFDDLPNQGRGSFWSTNYSSAASGLIREFSGAHLRTVTGGDYEEVTTTFWAVDDYYKRLYGISRSGLITFESTEFTGTCCGVDATITGDILVSLKTSSVTEIRKLDRSTGQLDLFITTQVSSHMKIASLPFLRDRDGDGLGDDVETNTGVYQSDKDIGTDPDNPDTDGDGLADGSEISTIGSNPLLRDTDGDSFDDGFEVSTGFSPLDRGSTPDTWSSIQTAVEFRFASADGQAYKVEASSDLTTWQAIETGISGTGSFIQRFYSIQDIPKKYFRAVKE